MKKEQVTQLFIRQLFLCPFVNNLLELFIIIKNNKNKIKLKIKIKIIVKNERNK